MDSSEGASLKIHNRHNRNLPFLSTSLKTKRFYEHPIIHKHNGQQVSNNHGSLKMESSFSNLTKNFTGFSSDENSTTSFSKLLPPAGYQLQKLQEVLVLFSFNGSDWATHELGSMIVYQLCQNDCIPSHQSQKESVLVDKESLKFDLWSMYISSSSFSSIREDRNNETQITWSFESYIRRLLKTF
ncbi:hypothetical protein Anas_01938 [Armadillidium nasatum]|uniref:Uncharacterized protein n=1 Tax=Armadillidium nasatum TaxID=96803 RepID=A0A5N5SJV1_9CRUS|nr:hypothetical protein Anas_01938 [Armadillidium nasatum]